MADAVWLLLGIVVLPLIFGVIARVVWVRGEREQHDEADPLEPFGRSGPRVPPVA